MAIFHVATNTPPKSALVDPWIRTQPWGPSADAAPADAAAAELVASFHLDDPDGEVGMQVFAVAVAGALYNVPLTYRAAPSPELAGSLIGVMDHSVLGPRYVYDGLGDDRFITVLAGVAACGYGQALGFAEHEGRWFAVPDKMLVRGAASIPGRVAVDGFVIESSDADQVVLTNDRLQMTVFRRLETRPAPLVGLTATWPGQPDPVALVSISER